MRALLLSLISLTAMAAEPKTEPSGPAPMKEWCVEIKTTRPGKDGKVEIIEMKICGPLPEPSKEPSKNPKQ